MHNCVTRKLIPSRKPASRLASATRKKQEIPKFPQDLVFRGNWYVIHAFDIGTKISDLDRIRTTAIPEWQLEIENGAKDNPNRLILDHYPVTWHTENFTFPMTSARVDGHCEVTVYDFAGLCTRHFGEFSGTVAQWRDLSVELNRFSKYFYDLAKDKMERIYSRIAPHTMNPAIGKYNEDYFVFRLDPEPLGNNVKHWANQFRFTLAQILRGENIEYAEEVVKDALTRKKQYSKRDALFLDWPGAILLASEVRGQGVLDVLQYANMELAELNNLIYNLGILQQLAIRPQENLRPRFSWERFYPPLSDTEGLETAMQNADIVFSDVNNAFQVTRDPYLAQVYRLASLCFGFSEKDATISRYLETLKQIHAAREERDRHVRENTVQWLLVPTLSAITAGVITLLIQSLTNSSE